MEEQKPVSQATPIEQKPPQHSNSQSNLEEEKSAASMEEEQNKPKEMLPQIDAKQCEQIVYIYGSCESDQFFIDGNRMLAKRPFLITYFVQQKIIISEVIAGAMHSIALSTQGKVYSWGCNDDSALGRLAEDDAEYQQPRLVDLPCPVDKISAGDSHSVAANSAHSIVFYWGAYRHTQEGNMAQPQKLPKQIGQGEFKNKKINKVLSGSNHTLVLADDKLYAWGDPDTFVLGYMPTKRRRIAQALKIELIYKKVQNVFTGASHSFLKFTSEKKNQPPTNLYYAWGLNQYGQLGIGNNLHTFRPTLIEEFRGQDIASIVGGEHFSMALTASGEVYVWGRNDDGQLGLGEKWYTDPAFSKLTQKKSDKLGQEGLSKTEKSEAIEEQQQSYMSRPDSINKPVKNSSLSNISQIFGGSCYGYAKSKEGAIFSWGMGDNYILGNKEEETVYIPTELEGKTYEQIPIQIGLGAQHVICLCSNQPNAEQKFKIQKEILEKIDDKLLKKPTKAKEKIKKNSISESASSTQVNEQKRSVARLESKEEKVEIQQKLKKSMKKK